MTKGGRLKEVGLGFEMMPNEGIYFKNAGTG